MLMISGALVAIELLSSDMELYGAFDERSQYDLKYMLIDLFAQLDNGKKKAITFGFT